MRDTGKLRHLIALAVLILGTPLQVGCEKPSSAEQGGHDHEAQGDHEAHQNEGEAHSEHDESGHDEGERPRSIERSAQAIESGSIRTESVSTGSLSDNVQATATVKHDINRVAHIAPLVEGQISDIRATLGASVEEGQLLARMRSVTLGEARSAVNEAKSRLDVARQNFQRQETLRDKGITSERSFIEARGELEQARARHDGAHSRLRALGVSSGSGPTYPLKSHISGTIIEQHASLGETKGPQDELFVVADQSRVWVIGHVAEQDAPAVHPTMDAVVTLDAYPDQRWEGTVDWVASTVDMTTRRLPIRVELDNPGGKLKPGMFGTLQLSIADTERAVPIVPVDAIQHLDGEELVFVPGEHDRQFVARPVELGAESDGMVEVVEGLSADARVVTRGAFDLKAALTAQGRSAAHHH